MLLMTITIVYVSYCKLINVKILFFIALENYLRPPPPPELPPELLELLLPLLLLLPPEYEDEELELLEYEELELLEFDDPVYLLLELFEYELLGCELDLVGVPVE